MFLRNYFFAYYTAFQAARRTEIKFVTEAMKEIEVKFEPTSKLSLLRLNAYM